MMAGPRRDIGARLRPCLRLTSEVMHERPAAPLARHGDDLDPVARQHASGGGIDLRREHRGDAAGQQRHAATRLRARLRGRRGRCGPIVLRQSGRRQAEHGGKRTEAEALQQWRHRPRQTGAQEGEPEQPRIGQHACKQRAQQTLRRRPAERLLDVGAGVIDEVHVVHARGTGGHAGQAG